MEASEASVDLYWLPLGAGGHSVRLNGRVFEALAARLERRSPCDLYHSALVARVPAGRFGPPTARTTRSRWRSATSERGGKYVAPKVDAVSDFIAKWKAEGFGK